MGSLDNFFDFVVGETVVISKLFGVNDAGAKAFDAAFEAIGPSNSTYRGYKRAF